MKYLLLALCLTISCQGFAKAKYTPDPSKGFEKMDFEEQAEFDQLVDEIVEDVCGYNVRLLQAKGVVDRQKEISKVAGTADVRALHSAASTIVDITPRRDERTALFKKVMGRDIKVSDCED